MNSSSKRWVAVLSLPLILAAFMLTFAVDEKLILFFVFTVFVILVWALEVLPSIHAAIMLPLLYVAANIAPTSTIFSPWLTFLPWASLAGLIYGNILGRTGLARRIALFCVKVMGGSFTAIAIGLMIAGIILAFLVPAIMARIVIFYAVTCGFADALDVDKRSRMSSAILMAGFFAATSPCVMLMTGTDVNLLGINEVNKDAEIITWGGYLLHNGPIGLLYCGISVALVHLIKGKERLASKEAVTSMVNEKLKEMGKFSANELKILILLIVGVSMFIVAGPRMGPWLFSLTACLPFFPGFALIDGQELGKINIGFLLFVTGCMAIGAVAGHLGIPAMIGSEISPLLQGKSPVMSVVISYITGLGLNFLLTPLAATSSMSAPLVTVATDLGMNPAPFMYSFFFGLEQYVLPYEYALWLFFFMENRMTLGHMVPALAARMVITLVLLVALAYPWWVFCGII